MGETLGWTIASIAINTKVPPIAKRRVNGSIPYIKEKSAAKTTSIVKITATFVVEILACDQVWITKAKAVAKIAVKMMTDQTCISGGATKPLIEAGIAERIAHPINCITVSAYASNFLLHDPSKIM